MTILSKFSAFVKSHFNDIIIFIVVVLLVLLAFASGYIIAKYSQKDKITVTNTQK
jgi:hypothetical protein